MISGTYDEPVRSSYAEGQIYLDHYINQPQVAQLGEARYRHDIQSTIGPFQYLPDWKAEYPEVVTGGLSHLYDEYNRAFDALVTANTEWDTDYRYCRVGPNGEPINFFVQVDMVGLPQDYLQASVNLGLGQVTHDLRRRIFEIENSLAMYQLLERICARNDEEDTSFKLQFRAALDGLRNLHGMPIALLAVTDQKHRAMRESEFGKSDGEPLSDDEVAKLSGFDAFLGPNEFADHLRLNNGRSGYLLYVRASDPVAKLRDPRVQVDAPLLLDPSYRRAIKEAAITFNVDDPNWGASDPRRINDTKRYLSTMSMAHIAETDEDLLASGLVMHMRNRGNPADYVAGDILSQEFARYLVSHGADNTRIRTGELPLRAKPLVGSYGCYGHLSGSLMDRRFRSELRRGIKDRGPYAIQPEMPMPVVRNEHDDQEYFYIDRNWLATDGKTMRFVGGYRSFLPVDSHEASMGRNHGSHETIWGQISAQDDKI